MNHLSTTVQEAPALLFPGYRVRHRRSERVALGCYDAKGNAVWVYMARVMQ